MPCIQYYQHDKIQGCIKVEAKNTIGRQTTFDWPPFVEDRDDMPTMAEAIEYLNELVSSAPIDKDALPCHKFETAVG